MTYKLEPVTGTLKQDSVPDIQIEKLAAMQAGARVGDRVGDEADDITDNTSTVDLNNIDSPQLSARANHIDDQAGYRVNLDPLFFIVAAIATVGIIGGLAAMYLRSDRLVQQHLRELSAETAALEARIAANELHDTTTAKVASLPETAVKVPDATPVVNTPAIPVVEQVSQSVVASEAVSKPLTVDEGQAAKMLAEIDSLKSMLARQSEQINLLAQENYELRLASEFESRESTSNAIEQSSELVENESLQLRSVELADEPEQRTVGLLSAERLNAEQGSVEKSRVEVSSVEQGSTGQGGIAQGSSEQRSLEQIIEPDPISLQPTLVSDGNDTFDTDFSTMISNGYNAYTQGDYLSARDWYDMALQLDPYSRDANLGVAAVAGQQGNNKLAENRYRHLLSMNPDDKTAFTALLMMATNDNAIEYELRSILEQRSRNPADLYAVLGNHYSQNGQWSEANQAYHQALADNPNAGADTLFNLAVSLDNLGQSNVAASYYQRALNAGGVQSFNRNDVAVRLKNLTKLP